MGSIAPSGMTASSFVKFHKNVERSGYLRLGYVETKYGTVYLAERFNGSGWTIMWAARDMTCEIECYRWSSQKKRKQEALNHAFAQLATRESVFREL